MFTKTFEAVKGMAKAVYYVGRDEHEASEIHNIVRPELEPRDAGDPHGGVWNFVQAVGAAALVLFVGWAFLWAYLFVTQPY